MLDDYNAIFQTNVIDLFPVSAFQFIRSIIKVTSGLEPEQFTRDLLGSLFHELIPQNVRHPVAAYYTNQAAARLLVNLAGIRGEDRVADFACRSGTLLVAAYESKAQSDSRADAQSRHATYLKEEITGIDIMPFAAHLAVVQLALMNPSNWTDKVRVAIDDSLEKKPFEIIKSLERHAVSPQKKLSQFQTVPKASDETNKGAISTDGIGTQFELYKPDVIVMNPPFSKKQQISSKLRAHLNSLFSSQLKYLSNEIGYWGYFVLQANQFLTEGGRIALVVPSSILRHASSEKLRQLLRDQYKLEFVVGSSFRTAFSEDASWPDVLLVATKSKNLSQNCTFAMLNMQLNLENVKMVAETLRSGVEGPQILVNRVKQSDLKAQDWLPFLPGVEIDVSLLDFPDNAPIVALSRIPKGARLIQGIRVESTNKIVNPKTL